MGWIPLSKIQSLYERLKLRPVEPPTGEGTDESGIALFMVIAAMTILSVIVTEFTYVAQVNARATVDSSDQLKAHYLAKTGLKISLLRLRAYKELRGMGKGKNSAGLPQVPRAILDQIWGFPFFYPIPAGVPGLTIVMKDEIEKFQKESSLPGKFTAAIESESGKIGINASLATMAPPPTPAATAKPTSAGAASPNQTAAEKEKAAGMKYNVEEARKGLKQMLASTFEEKVKNDQDFADQYRDIEIDELYDNILGWIDFSYKPKNSSGKQPTPYKRAPFYSLSELHMIRPIDDGLYNLFAPLFTPFSTPGVNVNKVKEPMLRVLLTGITDEEVIEYFKFRDDPDQDNTFKTDEDFFKWVSANVGALKSSTPLDELKTRLAQQGIQILTDEEIFKITVVAEVNKATRILEAWILLSDATPLGAGAAAGVDSESVETDSGGNGLTPIPTPEQAKGAPNPAGLRLLFMRES